MAKDQNAFFTEKKPWSEVKDDLLACYLRPYFQKLLATNKPVRYIDCFAGRGEFDDGKPGSPLIALDAARRCIVDGKSGNTDISLHFIESRWSDDLQRVATGHERACFPSITFTVINGRFERDAYAVVRGMAGKNVFLYIDPYGIRDLGCDLITGFSDPSLRLNSIELLINLNSFGFLRAGCQAFKVRYDNDEDLRDDEFDEEWDATSRSVDSLNAVAGGDYWQPVIDDFKRGQLDGRQAEIRFSALYREHLSQTYRYVLSMPIRRQERQRPKYRMVFASQHPAGCILMADNMMTRTDNLAIHIDSYKQAMLFDQDVEGEITDPGTVQDQVEAITRELMRFTDVDEVIADFYAREGVVCKASVVRQALAQLELHNMIEVRRDPPNTDSGKPSLSFSSKGRKVEIRAKPWSTDRLRRERNRDERHL
ncbi:MAG: three-Cys-motif partner protein TcmP [Propionibacteriaceae bacterium]|nr:three-Cys-motif partner protein TcmP [Propionibacteriaceae bacterium]